MAMLNFLSILPIVAACLMPIIDKLSYFRGKW